jgi:phosphate transport system permease protein
MNKEGRVTALVHDAVIPHARPVTRPSSKVGFDTAFRIASFSSAILVLLVLLGIMASMIYGGWPVLREFGFFGFLTNSTWDVNNDQYGAWPAVAGTLTSAFIALVIGVPISLGIAVYLTQLSPPWLKGPVATAIELLAAVPSIIYGMWGLFVFAPLVARFVQVPLNEVVEGLPIVGTVLYSRVPSGTGIATAGIILAFMIIPFIASITRDMLDQIPTVLRESAYGIGLHHLRGGALRARAPGRRVDHRRHHARLGRALGETMAVTFVVGNANRLSASIFDPGLHHRVPHRQRIQRGAGPAAQRAHCARAASCSSSPSSFSSSPGCSSPA